MASPNPKDSVTLFLGGDVMTGRGVDQLLPHPGDPALHEMYVMDARAYVELAERRCGPIPRPVGFDYIWGDALEALDAVRPDVRIVNLETSITTHDAYWPGKAIHYRMHPDNLPSLHAAGIHCCALANNHVLDFSRQGLEDTLEALDRAGIAHCGAGHTARDASRPATLGLAGGRRVRVYSAALHDSGIPDEWPADTDSPGIQVIGPQAPDRTEALLADIRADKSAGDVVLISVHWGGNWGYDVPEEHRDLACRLVAAGADVVHGHSSHHARGIEVIDGRPVLYGCGDLINDYEGIDKGTQRYRGELPMLYFVTLDAGSGALRSLRMKPLRIHGLRLQDASPEEAAWLCGMLDRQGRIFGTTAALDAGGWLELGWEGERGERS